MSKLTLVRTCLMAVLLGDLAAGCASGAHSAPHHAPESSPPAYLAQAPTCWNTMSCCIQRNPLTPVQSCGADPVEAARVLKGLEEANEAARTATLKGVDVPERGEERDDGEERPDWREYCIEQYTRCIDLSWTGNCSNCLDRCKGQRGRWPEDLCSAPRPRRRQ